MAYIYNLEFLHMDHAQQQRLLELCAEYEVRELSLFGSALREDFRIDSDLDFLVLFDDKARVGFMRFLGLREDLGELFKRKVDLVPKDGLKPRIRDRVLSEARLVYAG